MSNEYYIIHDSGPQGPYEMVSLVIKIRNGSLTPFMSVQRSDSDEVRPAQKWEEFADFFNSSNVEAESKSDVAPKQQYIRRLYLLESLKIGLNFLQNNQISTLFSGFFILMVLFGAVMVSFLIPEQLHTLCYLVGFVLLHFLLSCYLLLVMRMTRGQTLSIPYFLKRIQNKLFSLLRASLLISFPVIIGFGLFLQLEEELMVSLIGLFIIILPGIYTMTIYSFAPLLIVEKDCGVWEAMEISRKCILKSGSDNLGVYFSLNAINFIAGLFMLLPMVITLPVTMSAITEYYDELFS